MLDKLMLMCYYILRKREHLRQEKEKKNMMNYTLDDARMELEEQLENAKTDNEITEICDQLATVWMLLGCPV